MTTVNVERNQKLPGEALRSEAADILSIRYGDPKTEKRASGKKTDIYFEYDDFGKKVKLYVEAKDYDRELHRQEVVTIHADYSGIIKNNAPAKLLIVTRRGLSSDADAFVNEEQSTLRHQTIWGLENSVFQIVPYIKKMERLFEEGDLCEYYVEARARQHEDVESNTLIETIDVWLQEENSKPIAILAGYGSGKTSFARRLVSHQAKKALRDPYERRPILLKLGDITRASSLQGLLGALFTTGTIVQGYSYEKFIEFNQKGRFLIVLDGFDEMKHAMSWADFRTTVSDLNKLTEGEAKVILIGRPNAFLTDVEYNHVLKGRKPRGNGEWHDIIGWPKYQEYYLEPFNEEELLKFIPNYLSVIEKKSALSEERDLDTTWINIRSEELSTIVKNNTDVFSRPVHARILVEIAVDRNFDLSTLIQSGVSKWDLYQLFFELLADRETEKEARKPISSTNRLNFLSAIATHIWLKKNKSTNFTIDDIPEKIFQDLPDGNSVDEETKKREYLSGSFLERKAGDIYFFPHRSFAEFLIARQMIKKIPMGLQNEEYSELLSDGIEQFLSENKHPEIIQEWIKSIADTRCTLSLSYVNFLSRFWQSENDELLTESVWKPAFIACSKEDYIGDYTLDKPI